MNQIHAEKIVGNQIAKKFFGDNKKTLSAKIIEICFNTICKFHELRFSRSV
jgi:hypothetical protein